MLRSVLLLLLFLSVIPGSSSAFPGANGKIAFSSNRDAMGDSKIFTMNPDGSGPTTLTKNAASDSEPAWSRDGTKIAFVRGDPGEVYVMNADGSGQTNLTNDSDPDGQPAWSPDGAKIAFGRGAPGAGEVYLMNADGSGQTNLTNAPGVDTAPAWSPDGTKIAFETSRDGNWEIYAMNADGSAQVNLTSNAEDDGSPAWSPDGTKIAFTRNSDIFVMNADGSGQANRTNHLANDRAAAWSPDGTKIAFQTIRNGNREVYVMNADGGGQTNLTNHAAIDLSPDWQALALPEPSTGSGPLPTDTSRPLADTARPRISRLSLTHKVFRATGSSAAARKKAPRGTSFGYTLSEAAGVNFAIQRKLAGRRVRGKCRKSRNRSRRKCARFKTVGRLVQNGVAGRNSKPFSGRLEGRKLAPGRYRAQLTAQDATGNRSDTVIVGFRVLSHSLLWRFHPGRSSLVK